MYYGNIKLLRPDDVLLVSYPGSGTTWLANILSELRLNYIDGYTENLISKDSWRTSVYDRLSRKRTPSVDRNKELVRDRFPRIIKTHYWPEYFECSPPDKIILLIRDGRDSVLSYYNWRLTFSEEGERGSFSDFLRRPGFNGVPPLEDWAQTYLKWKNSSLKKPMLLIKLEEGKASPALHCRKILEFLRLTRSQATVRRACKNSEFEAMRKAELEALREEPQLGPGTIMRSGAGGQWKEAFSRGDLELISTSVRKTLAELGYCKDPDSAPCKS